MSVYDRMVERYDSGELPWDDTLPPPEVQDLLATIPVGQALDLGCGPGRAAIYMTKLGWHVDAIDFVPQAIDMAKERARTAKVSPNFHLGSVIQLDFLQGPYDFALDVGCCHALTEAELRLYHAALQRLLRPDAYFLLFARLREATSEDDETTSWQGEDTLLDIFKNGFRLEKVVRGETDVGEGEPWRSAWFWFVRNENL